MSGNDTLGISKSEAVELVMWHGMSQKATDLVFSGLGCMMSKLFFRPYQMQHVDVRPQHARHGYFHAALLPVVTVRVVSNRGQQGRGMPRRRIRAAAMVCTRVPTV